MSTAITTAILLARIFVIALGETIRLLGSLVLLLVGKPGITATEAAPGLPRPLPVVVVTPSSTPTVYREPLQRDCLTGQIL